MAGAVYHCTVKVLTGETRKLTKASAAIARPAPGRNRGFRR